MTTLSSIGMRPGRLRWSVFVATAIPTPRMEIASARRPSRTPPRSRWAWRTRRKRTRRSSSGWPTWATCEPAGRASLEVDRVVGLPGGDLDLDVRGVEAAELVRQGGAGLVHAGERDPVGAGDGPVVVLEGGQREG